MALLILGLIYTDLDLGMDSLSEPDLNIVNKDKIMGGRAFTLPARTTFQLLLIIVPTPSVVSSSSSMA